MGLDDEKKEADRSTTIELYRGHWRFNDNFFGGEPYGGREVIFYEDQPVWVMVYYGRVEDSQHEVSKLYGFLKQALALVPDDAPYRGPKEFTDGEWRYENLWQGEIDNFAGEETIYCNQGKVYSAKYMGGLVDQPRSS